MICFHLVDTKFRIKDKRKIRELIQDIVLNESKYLKYLNIILGSDEYVLEMNKKHLGHHYYTDVLTFDLSDKPEEIYGDIYISSDRVKENAMQYSVRIGEELKRVIIHGVLHLMGYLDKTQQQKIAMRQKEDFYLSRLV